MIPHASSSRQSNHPSDPQAATAIILDCPTARNWDYTAQHQQHKMTEADHGIASSQKWMRIDLGMLANYVAICMEIVQMLMAKCSMVWQ